MGDPMFKGGDQIDLSFKNHGLACFNQGALAFVETEEDAPLGEDGCLGRVHVFRLFLRVVEDPSAEGDHLAVVVADREHQPVAEAVVASPLISLPSRKKASGEEFLTGEALSQRPVTECLPSSRGVADLPAHRDLLCEAAVFQIGACMFGFPGAEEVEVKPCGGLPVEFQQTAPLVASFLFPRIVVLHQDDPGALGQFTDCREEIEMLVIHHKTEDSTARPASEAVERLTRGIHMEGGTLLLVEGADRPKTRPCPLQGKVAADDLHDVAGVGNLLDTLFGDARHVWESKREMVKGKRFWVFPHTRIKRAAEAMAMMMSSQSKGA